MSEQPKPHQDASRVAGELRVTLGQLVRRLREQAAGSDLTKSQMSALLRIEREGTATSSSLAEAEGMRPQSMAKIVRVLEGAGLISGSPDPKDGRKTLLSLTPAAQEQFRIGRSAREDWLTSAIDASLSDDEIAQLASAVKLLRRLAQSP
ncbi:MarR family winged helix-turn-helix transcriptional regulator [Actinoallomurus soli]|uniref:MarR family winged helix-turn-helix transcriptional regulator n=1 Tax=Actinoallomurus soli TaxID=2952535 RepID=UPI002092B4E3|nr:MarR family transcriptional regulator [Actinoallomurus soli]MCO5972806.1 MarR family transcriptional regulator [Actinoallomurus soli]